MRASFLSFSLPARRRPSSSFCPGGVRLAGADRVAPGFGFFGGVFELLRDFDRFGLQAIGRLRLDLFQIVLQLLGLVAQQCFGALNLAAHAFLGLL